MRDRNIAFDEAFKRLDNLCRDMYKAEKGVTSYIEHMKSIPPYESRRVADWDYTLRRLQELRHSRNQLAHQSGTWDTEICTEVDIAWLEDFRQRIFNRADPIAMLEKYRTSARPVSPVREYVYPQYNERNVRHTNRRIAQFVVLALLFVGTIILLLSKIQ